jgi:hypothetical protein
MKSFLKVLLFSVLLSSCSSQIVKVGRDANPPNPAYDKNQAFFIYGIGQTQEIDGRAICKEKGINRIRTKQTFGNILLTLVTFGIYTPRTTEVYCN